MQRNKRNHLKLDNKKFVRMCHESCLHRARPSGEVPKSLVARSAHCSFSSGAPGLEEMKHELNGSSTGGVQSFFQIRTGLQLQNWVCWRRLRAAAMLVQSQRNFVSRKQIPTAAMPALHFNVCPTPANPAQKKNVDKNPGPLGGLCVRGVCHSLNYMYKR